MVIEIALDDYDDIFSDFDIRDYNERIISTDFMGEVIRRFKRLKKCPKRPTILLTVPKYRRKKRVESIIKRRVINIFKARKHFYEKKASNLKKKGVIQVIIGLIILIITYIIHESLFADFLLVPSWFFTWNGLDILVNEIPGLEKRHSIFECLSNSRIIFKNEEDVYES